MPRRIFVGDVQGCREELEALLAAVRFDPAADALHPVGDLVNRGPDSLGCLRLARALDARSVLGNHDLHLLRAARGTRRLGPGDTLDAVLAAEDRDDLLGWLAAQPFLRVHADLYQVHAALHPAWADPAAALAGIDPATPHPASDFATRARWCDAAGRRPADEDGDPGPPFRPWYEHHDPARHAGRRAVFGHWSLRGLVDAPQAVGLDTGCVWGRELTAWIPEEQRFVQVPARRQWAPFD